jgi:hypothetical protein
MDENEDLKVSMQQLKEMGQKKLTLVSAVVRP